MITAVAALFALVAGFFFGYSIGVEEGRNEMGGEIARITEDLYEDLRRTKYRMIEQIREEAKNEGY